MEVWQRSGRTDQLHFLDCEGRHGGVSKQEANDFVCAALRARPLSL
jgi:hypothetical protein